MLESFRNRGLLLATEFAKKVAEGVLIEDILLLDNSANKLETYPDIGYVSIYGDLNTKLITRIFIIETFEDNQTLKSLPQETYLSSLLRDKKRIPVLEILTPVIYENEIVGAVQLGMSLQRIDKEVMNRTRSSIFLVTVFIMLSLMVSYLLSLSITQPINALVHGVKMISAGKLSHIVESNDKSEIGELADSINKMTADLRNTTVSINILEKEQQRFRDVAESSGDWIWEVDAQGRYVYSNHTVENILGYKSEYILGKFFYDFYPPNEKEEFMTKVFTAFHNKKEIKDFINYGLRKDGNNIIIVTTGVPILDPEGKMVGYRGVNRDITKTKQASDEKENLQRQLLQSQKMESIGTMASGIAHNFNNILATIRGYTEMALDDTDQNSRTHSDLQKVIKGVISAQKLAQQMLIYSRSYKEEAQNIAISPVIKEVLSMFKASVKGAIEIRENIDNNCGYVLADSNQIQHVILNICTNSVHSMNKPNGFIEISLSRISIDVGLASRHKDLKEGDYVKISIEDNGHGIDKDTLDRVFEPFFTTKEVGKGTGLGLSMVQGIIKSYNGEITVESEVGKGTIFTIYLPRTNAI
ncbi:MAG: hypothetical protein A2Y06_03560 [Omnitrophica WOR_2 bacterium GWA2_37_7]|nr:MAG: hypothetical protein A2Y06_03560 [Omnitrophica WOR_2 bacterium GWA2_37_7]